MTKIIVEGVKLPLMHDALADIGRAINAEHDAATKTLSAQRTVALVANAEAPGTYWMIKGSEGFDFLYYKTMNTRVKDAVKATNKVAEKSLDMYSSRVRAYAAEDLVALITKGDLKAPSDKIWDNLLLAAEKTPAAQEKAKKAKRENAQAKPDKVKVTLTPKEECVLIIRELKAITAKTKGPWFAKIARALKGL
jgi:hypothetical protein